MSKGSALYRFHIDLSDIDRSVYEALDLRLAMHASESPAFLITRLLAYVLNVQPGLEFSAEGLANPDEPCMSVDDPRGGKGLWIEVGSPSARRLHKAAKASRLVKLYTFKNPQAIVDEIKAEGVYQAERMEIFAVPAEFLERVEARLSRNNEWGIVHNEGSVQINFGEESETGELVRLRISS
jgi:uncharacterized protein YaeQ